MAGYAFLISFREFLEIALILGLLLAGIVHWGGGGGRWYVWSGAGVALLASVVIWVLLSDFLASLRGPVLPLFEGLMMLLAAGILTYCIFWMRRQAFFRGLEGKVRVVARTGGWSLFLLAFSLVIREGLELVVFLRAGLSIASSAWGYVLSALAGGVVAVVVGTLTYLGALRLPVRTFFRVTGAVLIFFAAGLLSNALHEWREGGWLGGEGLWDTSGFLSASSRWGAFLHTLFGYDPEPTLLQVAVYLSYLVLAFFLYFRRLSPEKT